MTPASALARVVVVGTTCSGKTTLARRLAGALRAPHVELDALHWGPGWTRRPDFAEQVLAAAREPRWVVDGNYAAVRDLLWRRSTAIVWLDYSFPRVLARALRRTVRRVVTRERLFSGNRETIRNQVFDSDGVLWWVARTHGRRRREIPELLEQPAYAHAAMIRLRGPAAAEVWLAAVQAGAAVDMTAAARRTGPR